MGERDVMQISLLPMDLTLVVSICKIANKINRKAVAPHDMKVERKQETLRKKY